MHLVAGKPTLDVSGGEGALERSVVPLPVLLLVLFKLSILFISELLVEPLSPLLLLLLPAIVVAMVIDVVVEAG